METPFMSAENLEVLPVADPILNIIKPWTPNVIFDDKNRLLVP
jgi:hypothetical protein